MEYLAPIRFHRTKATWHDLVEHHDVGDLCKVLNGVGVGIRIGNLRILVDGVDPTLGF